MTIEVHRPSGGTFLYRQREDEPNVIESRATYRGSRWQFVARFDTADEARQALLAIGKGTEEDTSECA
jgi:hypothetical protein